MRLVLIVVTSLGKYLLGYFRGTMGFTVWLKVVNMPKSPRRMIALAGV